MLQRAVPRWLAISALMAALLALYTLHPYYRGEMFEAWRPVAIAVFAAWLVLGLPYVSATLRRFPGRRHALTDSGLHLLLLARAAREHRFWRRITNRRLRTTVLGIVVKAFYLPLMTNFLTGNTTAIANLWAGKLGLAPFTFRPHGAPMEVLQAWWHEVGSQLPRYLPSASQLAAVLQPGRWTVGDGTWALDLAYNAAFMIDCGWALMGYASESRWLGNKTRSVEPTALGWTVALACYPPFNDVLGTYLPLGGGAELIHDAHLKLVLKALIVALFIIYASATVAFGFKFSNLTNRGIVTRGPYAVVRHPAYACKCTAWWLENLPTLSFQSAFFLVGVCGVYGLRAWTEERHLGRDPEYRAYKRRVKWAVLPGVF